MAMQLLSYADGGGGATRLKHLAGRGAEVVHCRNVPPDVRDFFQRELDRAKKATADRSPPYQESEDISSADDGDDGDGADPDAGGGGSGAHAAAAGSSARGVRFTGIHCTYK